MYFCDVGTHCAGILPHRQAVRPGNMLSVNQEIPDELVQADEAVLCPLLAGQMSVSSFIPVLLLPKFDLPDELLPQIHDGLLVHASDANGSGKRRCGFVIRFVPTCAYPVEVGHVYYYYF